MRGMKRTGPSGLRVQHETTERRDSKLGENLPRTRPVKKGHLRLLLPSVHFSAGCDTTRDT
jgi:hypothetical protein